MRQIILSGKLIDDVSQCYTIAEIGHNHGGNLPLAKTMIAAAKKAGADCVKFQKRTNKELYTPEFYNSPYSGRNSYGKTYGEHREALEFDKKQYEDIRDYCKYLGIGFSVTAFDRSAVEFIADLGVDFIKVASGDLTSLELLNDIAQVGVPVVFSTGGATGVRPIYEAYNELASYGSAVACLHCTSGYPIEWKEANLRCIEELRAIMLHTVCGWSMHTKGISLAPVAYALGARIIEAHFTLDRYMRGTDQYMSLEPDGFSAMVRYLDYCRQGLGDGVKRRFSSEKEALKKQWKNAEGQIDGKGGIEGEY